jgi:hypothetical protein
MVDLDKQIQFSLKLSKILKNLELTSSEFLIIVLCLNFLDSANCLAATVQELADVANTSLKTTYTTLHKVENLGVIKNQQRYDFTNFLAYLDKYIKVLDNLKTDGV